MLKEEEEPASPGARLMAARQFNLCIISLFGYKTRIDPSLFKKCIERTLVKHPRFSSILIKENGKCLWKRTKVDVDNHVFVPDLDPDMESSDEFVEDFASDLSKTPLDMTKPLWEYYILNVKTSDANSVAILKIHHSMGDGVTMMALTHACSTKISDPESLPAFPLAKKRKHVAHKGLIMRLLVLVWTMMSIIFNTLFDCILFLVTILFLKDTKTPIKAAGGVVPPYRRFVHRIVNLDDVKLVKTAMKVSVNDVVVGVTEAGLSRYLNTRYEKKHRENGARIVKKSTNFLPKNIRLSSAVVINLRPSPTIEDLAEMMEKEELNGIWGNAIAIVLLPFTIDLQDDPLTHIRRAKSNMDRKKLSLGHKCAFLVMRLMLILFGSKIAAGMTKRIFSNTTLTFSNVFGPQEEVNLFGHHLNYIAPSVCGFPQSLVVHYQSYADKLIISIGVDEKLIPNPRQVCDDLVESLRNMKEAVIKRGLVNASEFC